MTKTWVDGRKTGEEEGKKGVSIEGRRAPILQPVARSLQLAACNLQLATRSLRAHEFEGRFAFSNMTFSPAKDLNLSSSEPSLCSFLMSSFKPLLMMDTPLMKR